MDEITENEVIESSVFATKCVFKNENTVQREEIYRLLLLLNCVTAPFFGNITVIHYWSKQNPFLGIINS